MRRYVLFAIFFASFSCKQNSKEEKISHAEALKAAQAPSQSQADIAKASTPKIYKPILYLIMEIQDQATQTSMVKNASSLWADKGLHLRGGHGGGGGGGVNTYTLGQERDPGADADHAMVMDQDGNEPYNNPFLRHEESNIETATKTQTEVKTLSFQSAAPNNVMIFFKDLGIEKEGSLNVIQVKGLANFKYQPADGEEIVVSIRNGEYSDLETFLKSNAKAPYQLGKVKVNVELIKQSRKGVSYTLFSISK